MLIGINGGYFPAICRAGYVCNSRRQPLRAFYLAVLLFTTRRGVKVIYFLIADFFNLSRVLFFLSCVLKEVRCITRKKCLDQYAVENEKQRAKSCFRLFIELRVSEKSRSQENIAEGTIFFDKVRIFQILTIQGVCLR